MSDLPVMNVFVLCVTLCWVVFLVAGWYFQDRADKRSSALKQQMLDKGFTADDIVRVTAAQPGSMSQPSNQS